MNIKSTENDIEGRVALQSNFPENPKTAVEAIDEIMIFAAQMKASDIHFDPKVEDTLVRFRVDGSIEEAGVIPKLLHEEVISRLKILSGARTDIHAVPQDGRWKTILGTVEHNIRISFMPTYHGENAVIRLLPSQVSREMSFAKLGFTPDHVRMIGDAMRNTNGLILVTGPTGSGKTTTLHTCLSIKAVEALSIITLEDPIEYEMPGVRQVHIRHSHGVTFSNGLRSALRQDPDVIMVGEVRDNETAKVAVHTALTGHLVLSTLHTNSAIEAIPRLVDMGVDHYLLASTLRLIIAQRLVRVICCECLGDGCADCRNTGFIGRSVIAEVCEIDKEMRELISHRAGSTALYEHAISKGFCPIEDDGMEKVEWGITTRAEVMRVLNT